MHTLQSAAFPLPPRLQAIVAALLAPVTKFVRMDENVAGAVGSRLEPHLQYDIGELDYDPQRIRSLDAPSSYERRLWLHHYPR
jgi:hypothetical protein